MGITSGLQITRNRRHGELLCKPLVIPISRCSNASYEPLSQPTNLFITIGTEKKFYPERKNATIISGDTLIELIDKLFALLNSLKFISDRKSTRLNSSH